MSQHEGAEQKRIEAMAVGMQQQVLDRSRNWLKSEAIAAGISMSRSDIELVEVGVAAGFTNTLLVLREMGMLP